MAETLLETYLQGLFPFSNFGHGTFNAIKSMGYRDEILARYSYAILNQATIDALKSYQPFLEVGAGIGYWAYEFKKNGIDYIATDPEPTCKDFFPTGTKCWTEIIKLTAVEAVRTYPNRTLLICWPGYGETWAYEVLKAFKGNIVVYVGEGQDGCCAEDKFFKLMNRDWDSEELSIPQWVGLHDKILILKKK